MAEEPELKISKHSSGVSIIIRLDQLWKNCHSFKRNGLYQKWNEELDSIWVELARDLKKDPDENKDYEKLKEKFERFDGEITNIGQINDNPPEGFETLTSEQIKKRNQHYKKLMEKEIFLTRVEGVVGKGTTFDEADDDWD